MAHQIFSSLLFFAGVLLSVGIVIVYGFNFALSKKPFYLFPVIIALLFGYTQVSNLIYESSILACAIVPDRTLWLSGGISLLYILILWYGFHSYRRLQAKDGPQTRPAEDGEKPE